MAEYNPYTLKTTLTNHTGAILSVKFSNNGKYFASSSLDKTIIVFSTETLSQISHLISHTDAVNDISWSSDSNYICSASNDSTLCIWDARAAECLKTLENHVGVVSAVNFNLRGDLIVSGGFDETVRVWDVETERNVHVIEGHKMPVTSVCFNKDGSLIVSGSLDGTCKIWDTVTGGLFKTLIDGNESPAVSFVKFTPNGMFILVGTLDDTLRLWNYSVGKNAKFMKVYTGHKNKVRCIESTFSLTAAKYIVSGSEDHCVYLWNLQGQDVVQKLEGHTDTVSSVSCHPIENMIVSAGLDNDRTLRVWVQD